MPYWKVQAEFLVEAADSDEAERRVDILCEGATSSYSLDDDISYEGTTSEPQVSDPPPWISRHSDDCLGCLPTPSGAGVQVGRHLTEPVVGNPLFPHGQCPACGTGVNWAGACQNSECSSYVPGAEDEEE